MTGWLVGMGDLVTGWFGVVHKGYQ